MDLAGVDVIDHLTSPLAEEFAADFAELGQLRDESRNVVGVGVGSCNIGALVRFVVLVSERIEGNCRGSPHAVLSGPGLCHQ